MIKKIAFCAIVVIIVCVGLGWCWLHNFQKHHFTYDAVQVIPFETYSLIKNKTYVTQADINSQIKFLHNASVIKVCFDTAGNPVDWYGNPFEVTHKISEDKILVSCVSFGPDRDPGTADDIICIYKGGR
jgi:hypothetical protein